MPHEEPVAAPTEPTEPAEPVAAPEPTPAASPYFSDLKNGVLSPDFANQLGDELMPFADTLNQRFGGQSIAKLAKSYGEANKMISEGGRPLGYPADDAPPEQWDKWAKANGLSEEFQASDYKLFGDQPPEWLSPEENDRFSQMMLENKVPPPLARKIAQGYAAYAEEATRAMQDAYENQMHKRQQALQKELGAEYETAMRNVKGMVADMGFDPSDGELFDNPKVVQLLVKTSRLLGEDRVASMRENAQATGAFASDPAYEARRIMTDSTHPDHAKYAQGDPAVAAKVTRLLQQSKGG